MLKKIFLLMVVLTSCKSNDMNAMAESKATPLRMLLEISAERRKAIMNTITTETQFAGIAMGCHTTALLIAHRMSNNMNKTEKVLMGAPTILFGMYVGKQVTNMIHGFVDTTEKHKAAQLIGFGCAFALIDMLIKYHLI